MTHNIKADGAAFSENRERLATGTGGFGFALCSCGWMSAEGLESRAARKRVHAEHKANPITEITTDWIGLHPLPRCYWRVARNEAVARIREMGLEVVADNNRFDLAITGPKADVQTAMDMCGTIWQEANEAINRVRQTPEYRAIGRADRAAHRALVKAETDAMASYFESAVL